MKKDKFQHRTNEELKKLILKNKFTDNDWMGYTLVDTKDKEIVLY